MKEFLMLFWNVAGDGSYSVSPEEMQAGMAAWQAWIGNIAMQGKLISTQPIEYQGITHSNAGTEEQPAIKDNFMVTGYLLCKAEDKEEIRVWSETCPILKNPQGFVEIRAVSPFEM